MQLFIVLFIFIWKINLLTGQDKNGENEKSDLIFNDKNWILCQYNVDFKKLIIIL